MKPTLEHRKLAVIERLVSIKEAKVLEQVLSTMESALPSSDSKLSDWAHKEVLQGLADSAAGRVLPKQEALAVIEGAIEKAKAGKNPTKGNTKAA